MKQALQCAIALGALFLSSGSVHGMRSKIVVEVAGIDDPGIIAVEGIGAEIRTLEVDTGGREPVLTDALDTGKLTLIRPFSGSSAFIDWFNTTVDQAARVDGIIHRDIALRQRIGAGTGLNMLLLDAFPVGYSGPELGAGAGDGRTESLTLVYNGHLTVFSPDPFKITGVSVLGGELLIEWMGTLGDGHIEYASSPRSPEPGWSVVAEVLLQENGETGSARIPLSQFSGNRFFFRIEKP